MRKRWWLLGLLVVILGLGWLGYDRIYLESDNHATQMIDTQLNTAVKSSHHTDLLKLAKDTKTEQFIRKIPKNAQFSETSGFQGGSKHDGLYVTAIDHHTIDLDVEQTGRTTWRVTKISVRS